VSGEGKLVRDGVAGVVGERGLVPVFRHARSDDEHGRLLRLKLVEEVGEAVLAGPEDLLEELADVVEACLALADLHGFTPEQVFDETDNKRARLGGFGAGTVLFWRDTCNNIT
jgi:predicted house-cleaning noncanonical NTP pyrophosphatase (MazG superfamily)